MRLSDGPIPGLRVWVGRVSGLALFAGLAHTLLTGGQLGTSFFPGANWFNWTLFAGAFFGIPAVVLWLGGRWPEPARKLPWWALAAGFAVFMSQWLLFDMRGLGSAHSVLFLLLSPVGLLSAAMAFKGLFPGADAMSSRWTKDFGAMFVLVAALALATNAGLGISRIIFPATWDYHIYRIDGAFGTIANDMAIFNDGASPFLRAFTHVAYDSLIFALYCMLGLAIRKNALGSLNVWRVFVLPFVFAFGLYAFIPVSGPVYLFYSNPFPEHLPQALDVVAKQVIVPPSARNGMPSMHFTGALLVWMLSIGLWSRIAILFSSILVVATVWSTIATGEHYLLDLVVALPYAAFMGTVLIWPERLRLAWKVSAPVWLAGISFVCWLLIIRVAPEWLSEHPWFVRSFSAWSLLCAVSVFWGMVRLAKVGVVGSSPVSVVPTLNTLDGPRKAPGWVVGAFLTSGLAGLVYEVVYAKALAVTFGSTSLASYTVLATYMGGMALGAWLGGIAADHLKRPLRAYAVCEMLIGLYAALTPLMFQLVQHAYVSVSLDAPPDAPWLTVLRVSLGVAALGLPTLLMGATLPLMFKYLRGLGISSEGAITPLYGANVLGAALGSVVAGYFLLPAVGRNGGTYLAAVVSLLVALYVLEKEKRGDLSPLAAPEKVSDHAQVVRNGQARVLGAVALLVLFIGGAVTLGLEVNTMHLLAVVAGNSVYAFGLMLAMFLAGLGLGSYVGGRFLGRFARIDVVAWSQLGIAIAIGVTAHIWDDLPSYFSSFALYPVRLDFVAREAIRAMVCGAAMLPVAFFIGASYPAAMSLVAEWLSPNGHASGIGVASGINTAGNIFGVIAVGFWLLPLYGSRDTAFGFAAVASILGVVALLAGAWGVYRTKGAPLAWLRWTPLLGALGGLFTFPVQWDFDALATGSNVYFKAQQWGDVIDHAESVEGGLTSVAKNDSGVLTLLTNGKFQGNDSAGGEMLAQESFGLFPLLHTASRGSALVIGYGTGMTTRVLSDAGFQDIQVVELSKDIVRMANRYFENINHGVTDRSGVNVSYTDGRNFLLTQSKRFDLISIEITSIWFAGAANLYNQDFYALAKKRLAENGVLQQWVQLHHITPTDIAYVIGSVRSEFKYVWLYVRGGQGIIVASNSKEATANLADKARVLSQGQELQSHLVLSPAGVDRFISSLDPSMKYLVSTDSNLYLEHSTPKGNALGDVLPSNLKLLSGFERGESQSVERQ